MPFIFALILIGCIVLALPYLKGKDILKVLLGMACIGLGVVFLWWLAMPIAIIWFIFLVAKRNYRSHSDAEFKKYSDDLDSGKIDLCTHPDTDPELRELEILLEKEK